MAGNFDVPDVRGMILRANVVMLHYTGGIEIGDKWLGRSMRFICGIANRIIEDVV
jgi:mannitol/fructose-specific phosphotransferase system IIA component